MSEPTITVTGRSPVAVERELSARYRSVRLDADDEPFGPDGLRTALRKADVVLSTIIDLRTPGCSPAACEPDCSASSGSATTTSTSRRRDGPG
jgi:hypothetical protein